jgi:hypothetical protein
MMTFSPKSFPSGSVLDIAWPDAGAIVGLFANLQPGFAEEYLADADPAVVAFRDPPPGPVYLPVPLVRERLEAAGAWPQVAALLFQPGNEAMLLKLLTLAEGIAPDDPQARSLIAAAGANPDLILAPV